MSYSTTSYITTSQKIHYDVAKFHYDVVKVHYDVVKFFHYVVRYRRALDPDSDDEIATKQLTAVVDVTSIFAT